MVIDPEGDGARHQLHARIARGRAEPLDLRFGAPSAGTSEARPARHEERPRTLARRGSRGREARDSTTHHQHLGFSGYLLVVIRVGRPRCDT